MGLVAQDGESLVAAEHGLLLACRPARVNPHGVTQPEHIRVLTASGRQVGTWLRFPEYMHAVHWRTAKGDVVEPPTLEALLERCAS